jgi:mannonate dehydratase
MYIEIMKKTWRWFGKADSITLNMLRQINVEGIVTALHDIPNGDIWPIGTIQVTKKYIESFGLEWSVVESLPVCEEIKYGGKMRDKFIDNYIISLENLGKEGIKTVCYNFMPVIDWIRTDLDYPLADGASTLYFDKIRFAYFDCFIIKRQGAENDYTIEEMGEIRALDKIITGEEKNELINTIIVKTQSFINDNFKADEQDPVVLFQKLLSLYEGIDRDALRENMKYFLFRIMPVCNKYGIDMCVHPDDPPMQVLGLPRIVTDKNDIEWILNAVDDPRNGLTFCAGSLSSGIQNDVPELARLFAHRTHFVHLRSTNIFPNGNFMESSHLDGRGHLIELVRIFEKANPALPMRVDHGKLILDDRNKGYNPGYSFHGRMYALAQMDGVIATVNNYYQKQ